MNDTGMAEQLAIFARRLQEIEAENIDLKNQIKTYKKDVRQEKARSNRLDKYMRVSEHINDRIITERDEYATRLAQEQHLLRQDLERAREVLKSVIPDKLPQTSFFNSAVFYQPMDAVGGDFYDMFHIDADCYGIVVADVCGHGLTAAVISSMIRILVKDLARRGYRPADALDYMNQILVGHIAGYFLTCWYGILDCRAGRLEFANAGHPPHVVSNPEDSTAVFRNTMGSALTLKPEGRYSSDTIELAPGQRLFIYTDGLTDAHNSLGQYFDGNLMLQAIVQNNFKALNDQLDSVIRSVKNFSGSLPFSDDVTLFALEVLR